MSAISRRDIVRLASITVAGSTVPSISRADTSRSTRQTGEWPQFQFDTANTGYSPDANAPKDGVELDWMKRLNDGNDASPAASGGRVYSGAWDGTIHAQRVDDGEQIWERNIGRSTVHYTPAVVDGTVYAGTGDGTVYALDAADGTPRWSFDPENEVPIRASPLVIDDTVYVPSLDGHVYALRTVDGRERWRFGFDIEKGLMGFPSSPAFDDNTLYVGSSHLLEQPQDEGGGNIYENKERFEEFDAEGFVHAVDSADGTEKWRVAFDHLVETATTVYDGTVYAGSWDRTVRALDTADGTERWRFNTKDVVHSTPAIANDTLFVADWSGQVYALSVSDGSVKWRFAAGGSVQTPLAVASGTVYIGSDDSTLYAINATDGTEQWRFRTNAINVWAPAIANGHVYICDGDGRVLSLQEGDSIEASVSGPKKRATAATDRTEGRSNTASGSTGGQPETAGASPGSSSDTSKGERKRGFFSNTDDEPDFLSNAFNLTVIGFLLSIIGIVHQMLEGR